MKKLLLSLILSAGIISTSLNIKAGFDVEVSNKNMAVLAGSPFYAASLYCFYKLATYERAKGDYSGISNFIGDGFIGGAGAIAALLGALTSTWTYMYLQNNTIK